MESALPLNYRGIRVFETLLTFEAVQSEAELQTMLMVTHNYSSFYSKFNSKVSLFLTFLYFTKNSPSKVVVL